MGSSGSPYDNPTYLPNLPIPTNLPTCPTYLSYMALWLIQYSSDASIKWTNLQSLGFDFWDSVGLRIASNTKKSQFCCEESPINFLSGQHSVLIIFWEGANWELNEWFWPIVHTYLPHLEAGYGADQSAPNPATLAFHPDSPPVAYSSFFSSSWNKPCVWGRCKVQGVIWW